MFNRAQVTVVTAATGEPSLRRCIESVARQTYKDIEHWVVIDGPEREARVRDVLAQIDNALPKPSVLTLPHATGKDRWLGHRIYGAMSFLVNSEFIAFLDEDNWYEADHLSSLVEAVRSADAQWGFSLRKLVDPEGEFIALDNCENLGTLHHTFAHDDDFLVDTNCYLLPREAAATLSGAWYRPARPAGQLEADRMILRLLMRNFPRSASNRKHTVNYRVASRSDSVTAKFFVYGNEMMRQKYPDGLPWETSPAPASGGSAAQRS